MVSKMLEILKLDSKKEDELIPAFYIPYISDDYKQGGKDLLIYYHANGEDLGLCYEFLIDLWWHLKVNVLGVEYPSYGVYNGKPSEKGILEDSEDVV